MLSSIAMVMPNPTFTSRNVTISRDASHVTTANIRLGNDLNAEPNAYPD